MFDQIAAKNILSKSGCSDFHSTMVSDAYAEVVQSRLCPGLPQIRSPTGYHEAISTEQGWHNAMEESIRAAPPPTNHGMLPHDTNRQTREQKARPATRCSVRPPKSPFWPVVAHRYVSHVGLALVCLLACARACVVCRPHAAGRMDGRWGSFVRTGAAEVGRQPAWVVIVWGLACGHGGHTSDRHCTFHEQTMVQAWCAML